MLNREHNLDVGGRHPVLQHGAVLEVLGAGPVRQRGEGDPGAGGVLGDVRVQAERLLLVGPVDRHPVVTVPDLATVSGVILERLPGLAVIHRLVDGEAVRLLVAELEADVGQLVLLAEAEREADVSLPVGTQQLAVPARHVVRVVQVGQVTGRVMLGGVLRVADLADLLGAGVEEGGGGGGVAMPGGRGATHRARAHRDAVSRVNKVRDALLGFVRLVIVTRV